MNKQMDLSDDEVIDRAIRGDPSAYRLLLCKYKTFAFTIALKIVKNREDAEEVVQDSFCKAFKSLRGFNRSGKFSTWFYRIVFNTSLTKIRNKRLLMDSLQQFPEPKYEFDIPDNYLDGFGRLVQQDRSVMLSKALAILDESENLMITLYYNCENTIAEIETITGWNPSTIKTRLFRARHKLYTELSKMVSNPNELL
jgi:RNA polymerase sigma-70 factor (ECF subfamily)